MIYRALMELAREEGLLEEPWYEPMSIDYFIHLGGGGELLRCVAAPTEEFGAYKKHPRVRPVPRNVPRRSDRVSADEAEFLVDKAEYVFGVDPKGHRLDAKLANRKRLFRERVAAVCVALPHNAGLTALREFLDREIPEALRQLLEPGAKPEKEAVAGAVFAFVYQPDGGLTCVHETADVRQYFARLREDEAAERGQCLVTGEIEVPLARLHGKPKGIPPMSRTKGGVPLTSVNKDAFKSYLLDDVSGAPVSRMANVGVEKALNRLLDPSYLRPNGSRAASQAHDLARDTVIVYWAKGGSPLSWIEALDTADPEAVHEMLAKPWAGKPEALRDASAFYALILSGAQGRATVRSFVESTVQVVAENVDRYRDESRIVRPFGEGPGGFPLKTVREALAVRGDTDKGLPPSAPSALYLAVLRAGKLPRFILEAAVRRNRAELFPLLKSGRRDEKALAVRSSALKAYLIRNEGMEVSMALDEERRDVAYRLGRLLAVLDKLQTDVLPDVNATIVDRFYGAASTTPRAIFPTLFRRGVHHLSSLRRGDKVGLAITRERLMQEILSEVSDYPSTLPIAQQALFSLGFYHQRQDLFTSKKEKGVSE